MQSTWFDEGVLDQSGIRCSRACYDDGMRVPRLQTVGGLSNIFHGPLHEQHEPRLENFESQEKLCELINQSKEGLSSARKDSPQVLFVLRALHVYMYSVYVRIDVCACKCRI